MTRPELRDTPRLCIYAKIATGVGVGALALGIAFCAKADTIPTGAVLLILSDPPVPVYLSSFDACLTAHRNISGALPTRTVCIPDFAPDYLGALLGAAE